MGFFDKLFDPRQWVREDTTAIQESATVPRDEHLAMVNDLIQDRARILEDNGLMSLKLEDYMWTPVAGWQTDQGFSLGTLQDEADHCRALYSINPLIKKAVTARIGMIHGRGNRVIPQGTGAGASAVEKIVKLNERRIFGPVARARLEAELSSTGNVWAITERGREAITVPIAQIAGFITEVDDPSKVLFWKRSYQTQKTDMGTGQSETVIVTEYIPTSSARNIPTEIGDTPVRRNARMVHIAANRQEGWVLGLPDVFAAKFWSKGHKEMFEAGHEFALAQGQFAAKVTGGSSMGSQLAASRLADEPRRDYDTGEVSYGGTFIGSHGMDVQLLGKMGSGVDFKSYDRITALIAAATGVPVAVLLAESDSDEVTLPHEVVEDMRLRQKLWGEFYEDFFDGAEVTIAWPRIKQETVYRVNQSIEISNRTNTLSAEEKRRLTLEAYGLEGDARDVPDISEHPDVMVYRAKKELDLEYAPLIAEATAAAAPTEDATLRRSTSPDQGNDQGVGKLSDGADAHDARDAGEQEHTR